MEQEDAFRIALPHAMSWLTVGDLLNEVFPESATRRDEWRDLLDVRTNPDLPAMYEELVETFRGWRRGECVLRFFAHRGPDIELFHSVASHVGLERSSAGEATARPLLNLVIEQRYDALASLAARGGDKSEFVEWLKGSTLLYFMDKHEFRPQVRPSDEADQGLLPVVRGLESSKLIAKSERSGHYEITPKGRRLIGQMIAETESYIDQFDLFDDVFYDLEAGTVEFGTGRGADLRVQVYESEGMDPLRVVFLLRLYDASLDAYGDAWRSRIDDEGFFNEVLLPAVDYERVEEEAVGWIIESGYAQREERAERSRRRASDYRALRGLVDE